MRLWGEWARGRTSFALLAIAVLSLITQCSRGSSSGPAERGTGIGPAGGTVRSADGVVTLEIPAGALESPTPVEIQPIPNTAPSGLGSAFRLMPAGTTLSLPAQLTFALSPGDLQGTTLDAVGVGFAGTDGRWRSVNDVTRTTSAVTVRTTHFSDWSRLLGWQLRPPEKRVRSGEHVMLRVVDCEPTEGDDGLSTLVPECDSNDLLVPLNVSGWAVDGIPGGNLAVGFVTPDLDTADYAAPLVWAEESHAVSVSLTPRRTGPKELLVSNITVTAANEFTIVGSLEERPASAEERFYDVCPAAATSTGWMKDGVSFTVSQAADGTWSATGLVNQPTDYDRELQPMPPWTSVQVDADPDLFAATSVTVEPDGTSESLVIVRILGTSTTGACTGTLPDGITVPLPAQSHPDQMVFTFDTTKSTQTVGTQGLGWYFEIHAR